jgi:hypothetical protein
MSVAHAIVLPRARRFARNTFDWLQSQWTTTRPDPLIILGNQKAGTSAIAHLLANFGGLSKTIDIPPLWDETGARIARNEVRFADIANRHKRYFTTELIKEPFMTFFADQVFEFFPLARFIFVVRDPRENIRSLLNSRGLPTDVSDPDPELLSRIQKTNPILLDRSVWGGHEQNYVGVLAHRWNRAVDTYLDYRSHFILAKYEEFVANKLEFIRDLGSRAGVTERNDISDQLNIQFQPRGDRGRPWRDVFGDDNLSRIDEVCGEKMRALGYALACAASDARTKK